jgi:hypothetical protein
MQQDKNSFAHSCKNCDKHFKSNTGLWRHSKTCIVAPEIKKSNRRPDVVATIDKIIEVYNEHEYQFLFVKRLLNETFTYSINFIDFIESINIGECDNYIDSVVKPIITELSKIPLYKRPIFFIKEKNKNIIHVRENNEWVIEYTSSIQSNIKKYYLKGKNVLDSDSCIFSGIMKFEEKNISDIYKETNSELFYKYMYETMYPPNKFIILDKLIEYLGNETPTFMTVFDSMTV